MNALPDDLRPGTVAVLGLPTDENSSFMRGPALAPPRIRDALHSGSANLCSESGLDLSTDPRWRDLGDLNLGEDADARAQIEGTVGTVLDRGARVLALGGDHAVTYPVIRAYGKRYDALNILHLDAHPDLYDTFEGSRYSHACPFARIMEEGLVARLVQVGIRTMNPHQRAQAERFGVEVIEMRHWHPDQRVAFEGPVYLSFDMDVLDPAYAPGISHHEPGGFSTREAFRIIQNLEAPLVGADIVEFNPVRDPVGITAMTAAKLLKEIAAKMLETSS
ncbi:MAG: agmatinase [Rhodothermales bacterium]